MPTPPPICVSLGPGDPELITLKALRTLQRVDRIYCPATILRGETVVSRSLDIMKAVGIDPEKVALFHVPMSKVRSGAEEAYLTVAQKIEEDYKQGKAVAFVAEGDCGFYSSAHYISDYLWSMAICTDRIAGVPAFIACGALARLHIVSQEETLNVIPTDITTEKISTILDQGGTVVIMKLSLHEGALKDAIRTLHHATFHYFENVGIPAKEFYTSDKDQILARPFPYFAIMIIKR